MRTITKHADNPIQKLRLAFNMEQAELAALLGCSCTHLRKVECGIKPISGNLESQIGVLFGATRLHCEGPFHAVDANDKPVPFTMAALKRHQELLRNVFPQMDLPGVLLEIMQLAIEAASGDSEPEMAGCRSHAMHVQLMITIELLLKDFGLVKSMRKKAIALAQSKDKKQRVVGYYILVLTQSPHMLTAWYG